MSEQYGSDFITIVDEDGAEFELEVLTTLDYNGATYLAVTIAGAEEAEDLEVSILKSVEEDEDEPILCAVEDEQELETVYNLIMEQLYEEEDDED
ncbi:MAG: DUF1292 domain-containing protein [Oscillospiraceae bacterium]|nr:DUF1292 domain-containing protein [Oscillospiraceae bacterium]